MHSDMFSVGEINISYADLVWIFSLFIASAYLNLRINKDNWNIFINGSPVLLLGSIFVGRFVYIISPPLSMRIIGFNWQFYVTHLIDFAFIWEGGINLYGTLLGFGLVAYGWVKLNKGNFLKWADDTAISILLLGTLTQWANYFDQSFYGEPTSSRFSIFINDINRLSDFKSNEYYQPLFIIGFIGGLILIGFLLVLDKSKFKELGTGDIFGISCVLSGLLYLGIEQAVLDTTLVLNSILLCGMILVGVVVLFANRIQVKDKIFS